MAPKSHSASITTTRKDTRALIRQRRAKLSSDEQTHAKTRLCEQTLQFISPLNIENIAIYLAFDGEISTQPIIEKLWQQNINVYLPILHPFCSGYLIFSQYDAKTKIKKNKFGILEPQWNVKQLMPLNEIGIIFIPLVAFNQQRNRLGMGGGYYDRTLQHLALPKKTLLIGLAHQCQQADFPTEPWDIKLDKIIAV